MAKRKQDEQFFSFADKVKKDKEDKHLECHNSLCEARNNCKNYYGEKEDSITVNRESCRIYDPKEETYVRKNTRFQHHIR